MKRHDICKSVLVLGITSVLFVGSIFAQAEDEEVTFSERNLSGPRLGLTVIPRGQPVGKALEQMGLGTTVSQFGWHFEHLVIPNAGGPAFAIQFIPLVGGVEYGKFIISSTLALGVRLPNGIEFGMGPNILSEQKLGTSSALMLAVGKSFNYGGVRIPIDLVYVTNPNGGRIGIMFGYAISRSSK